jgi:hypothetical protein
MRSSTIFILSTLLLVSLAGGTLAQPPAPTPDAQLEQMEKIAWLAGSWEGEGWAELRPGDRHHFRGSETVESRLGGLVLVVEGVHRKPDGDEVVHHAFGMLTWDDDAELFRFRTQLADGRASDATGRFEDGAFVWAPQAPPGMELRYVIREDENGDWFEIGEVSRDGGESWKQFFEMRLERTGG